MEGQLHMLDNDINSLYRLCAEWNLSQNDINEGISGVFGSLSGRTDHAPSKTDQAQGKKSGSPAPSPGPLRRARRCMWVSFKVSLVLVVLFVVVYNLMAFYPPADRLLTKITQPLNYPMVRAARLLALPFVHTLQVSGWYSAECLVENPWFAQAPADCKECKHVTSVFTIKRPLMDNFEENFYGRAQPLCITDAMEFNVSLHDLQEMYRYENNADKLDKGILRFRSNSEEIPSISALLGSAATIEIGANRNLHLEWAARGVPAARIIRQLFPRPYFIPKESEVSLEKTILVDGPTAKTYPVPKGSFSNTWYAQGSGSRRLIFVPREECASKCKLIQVVVKAGQVVNFLDQVWRVDSVPYVEPGEEPNISVAFCGSYY